MTQTIVATLPIERLRDSFSSRFAFALSVAGSTIGLANIWRFPYLVGMFGGGTFLLVYFAFLLLVGFPAFFSEILIGKNRQERPQNAFAQIGGNAFWYYAGKLTVLTGFIVSAFYSVVAGWVLGYFFESISGHLLPLFSTSLAHDHFIALMQSPYWGASFHALFSLVTSFFLLGGIRGGIQKCNTFFMPLFFVLIVLLALWAIQLPRASEVALFMSSIDFQNFSMPMALLAMGHSFFTLSAGQGTLVTYASFLRSHDKICASAAFVLVADTLVSLLASFIILSILFSANMEPDFGPALFFVTLPTIFSKMPFGYLLSTLFFFLVFIAALTSQVSALQPIISEVTEKHGLGRKRAVCMISLSSFLLGLPAALPLVSYGFESNPILELLNFTTTSLLIPLGGLFALLLIGWRTKLKDQLLQLERSERLAIFRSKLLFGYFHFSIVYSAPLLIFLVFLHAFNVL